MQYTDLPGWITWMNTQEKQVVTGCKLIKVIRVSWLPRHLLVSSILAQPSSRLRVRNQSGKEESAGIKCQLQQDNQGGWRGLGYGRRCPQGAPEGDSKRARNVTLSTTALAGFSDTWRSRLLQDARLKRARKTPITTTYHLNVCRCGGCCFLIFFNYFLRFFLNRWKEGLLLKAKTKFKRGRGSFPVCRPYPYSTGLSNVSESAITSHGR